VRAWNRRDASTRLFALEASLVAVAIGFAVATSTEQRFTTILHGDEPKYIRHAENLYQGNGFDLTDFRPAEDLPLDASSHVWRNLALAVETVPAELRNLAADARTLVGEGPRHTFNRARYADAWFVYGKNGGFYQVHTPGLSLLLLPFYYVDRHFLSLDTTYSGQFAGRLVATNTFFLGAYALWGAMMFRLLRQYAGSDATAWLLAATATFTIPIAGFAFQMYPEIAAGMLLTAACGFLMSDSPPTVGRACWYGLLTGYLPWLHVRFLGVATALIAFGVLKLWRSVRVAAAFIAATVAPVALLCFYMYRITGSLMPTALYTTFGAVDAFSPSKVPLGLLGYLVDSSYGLLPYSPIYLLSILGLRDFFRRNRRIALLAAVLVLALAIPSAGHSFTAAGATPWRHLIAIVPLLLLPMADAVQRFRRSRAFVAITGVLLTLSVQCAVVYNLSHRKETGPMVDGSVSGWKIQLLFPDFGGRGFRFFLLVAIWMAALTAIACWPRLVERTQRPRVARPLPLPALIGAALIAIVCLGLVTPLVAGARFSPEYLISPHDAQALSLRYFVRHGCRICLSSTRGRLTPQTLFASPSPNVSLTTSAVQTRAGEPVTFTVGYEVGGGLPGWATLWLDVGDGQMRPVGRFAGSAELEHRFAASGLYAVTAHVLSPSGAWLTKQVHVFVAEESDRPF
jgi:hypothetical protein